MTVRKLAGRLNAKIISEGSSLDNEITGVYICDLLSWVMAHTEKGNAWITVLTNLNIVAVALLTEVACIIIPEGIEVEEHTAMKARQEGVCILSVNLSAFDISCITYDAQKDGKV